MRVSVAFAESRHQAWVQVEVPEGATVRDALDKSGFLSRFSEIDLTRHKVGIFGKVTTLDTALQEGDRIEIYRPITADPETVPRRDDA